MKQNYLAAKAFVYFGYNYQNSKEFIHYICEKTGKKHLIGHLLMKFSEIYDTYGSGGVMNKFFTEIDSDLQDALVEYACKVYYPNGFPSDKEGFKILNNVFDRKKIDMIIMSIENRTDLLHSLAQEYAKSGNKECQMDVYEEIKKYNDLRDFFQSIRA